MLKMDAGPEGLKSLDLNEIEEVAPTSRRSALSMVGSLMATAVFGAVVAAPSEAAACQRRTGRTDSDPSDGVAHGHTGVSDSDSGDEAQCGRGGRARPRRRCTDSDSGPGADGAGRGRHC